MSEQPTSTTKLKTTQVSDTRLTLLVQQGRRCAVCQLDCPPNEAVLDHDHGTGLVRGVLHRGCNSLLGKVENNHRRYGIKNLSAFLNGVPKYLAYHATNRTGLLHPTHKTEYQKREQRNAKARATRAAKRVGST